MMRALAWMIVLATPLQAQTPFFDGAISLTLPDGYAFVPEEESHLTLPADTGAVSRDLTGPFVGNVMLENGRELDVVRIYESRQAYEDVSINVPCQKPRTFDPLCKTEMDVRLQMYDLDPSQSYQLEIAVKAERDTIDALLAEDGYGTLFAQFCAEYYYRALDAVEIVTTPVPAVTCMPTSETIASKSGAAVTRLYVSKHHAVAVEVINRKLFVDSMLAVLPDDLSALPADPNILNDALHAEIARRVIADETLIPLAFLDAIDVTFMAPD